MAVRRPLGFEVDKLTKSIENAVTGEVFDTTVTLLLNTHLKLTRKSEWLFDWTKELTNSAKQVYKLATLNNPDIIHGLMSLEDKQDHLFQHLIESADFNRGKAKIYFGVAGNLVVAACRLIFEKGYDGYVAFDAKTHLIEHYRQTPGAVHFKGLRMYIQSPAAQKLVKQYFKN